MLSYLGFSSFLSKYVSLALAQAIGIPVILVLSLPLLSERRDGFLLSMLYAFGAGLLVYVLLKVFS